MLMKLLGMIDLSVALMITLVGFGVAPGHIYIAVALAHGVKALLFIKDVLSIIDLAIVAYTFILPFYAIPTLSLIIVIFLLLKGLYSFA